MSVKRFFGATTREAMNQLRAELGDDAIILSNRKVANGVEVLASAHEDIESMIPPEPAVVSAAPKLAKSSASVVTMMPNVVRNRRVAERDVQDTYGMPLDEAPQALPSRQASPAPRTPQAPQSPMAPQRAAAHAYSEPVTKPQKVSRGSSTGRIYKPGTAPIVGTFEDFMQRPAAAVAPAVEVAMPLPAHPQPTHPQPAHPARAHPQPATAPMAAAPARGASMQAAPSSLSPSLSPSPSPFPLSATSPSGASMAPMNAQAAAPAPEQDQFLLDEIQSMKNLLREQMGALSWFDMNRRHPTRAKLVSRMLSAGFSPALSRAITQQLPDDFSEEQAEAWVRDCLLRNIAMPGGRDIVEQGGVYALVGPTGVGKTTTAAKLAARCVVKYGAQALGLITIDSYRIGAQDQLRTYGKILGVTVHTARDGAGLSDLVNLMRGKHLVLIDTVGMGQRDERLLEQLQMLYAPMIERILVLNANAQGEALDEVVAAYRGEGNKRVHKVIVTKLDESVKYGFALDCLIRHKLELQFVTNGQRVPEDIHPANADYLVHRSLKHRVANAFTLDAADVPLIFAPPLPTKGRPAAYSKGNAHV